jgi:predicted RNA-binding protein with EMAP domain
MSALGITFVVFTLSWLVGRITSEIKHPVADLLYIIAVLIFGGALVTGIVLVGMML